MASLLDLALVYGWLLTLEPLGFPAGVENIGGEALQNLIGGLKSIYGGSMRGGA